MSEKYVGLCYFKRTCYTLFLISLCLILGMQIEEKKIQLTDRERWKTIVKRMDEGLRTAKRKNDKFCKKVEGFLTALNGKTPETNIYG